MRPRFQSARQHSRFGERLVILKVRAWGVEADLEWGRKGSFRVELGDP